MEIESNESFLRITAPSGDSLELNKNSDEVFIDGVVSYPIFIKLVKELKKARNKASFSVDFYED